ncbi:Asx homology domain-containing protein [Flammula alnicola]|nr:Asx homology domain-containing protein [Flammula alnicola]
MDRPRRSVRNPVKAPQLLVPEPVARVIKRKSTPEAVDPEKQLKILLESSKSDLVSLDMNDIINSKTWSVLSEDARAHLKTLLPQTAFSNSSETIAADHPSVEDGMVVDEALDDRPQDVDVNLGIFGDPHFLAAARTFQDHLYLNWFSEAHGAKVKQFREGIVSGSLAAPWKDQVWERDNIVPEINVNVGATSSFSIPNESSARAGGAAEIKLYTLVKKGILRVGDIIAYKRYFSLSEVTVEKDAIIQHIQPNTYALTVLTLPGPNKDLPAHLLSDEPAEPSAPVQSMTITSPTMLETGLLDLDGRMEKSRRPNGNAWKCFTVWRWRVGGEYNPYDSRGGRENHGTLFYLRGSYYHER